MGASSGLLPRAGDPYSPPREEGEEHARRLAVSTIPYAADRIHRQPIGRGLKRRSFVGLLANAAMLLPIAARGQQRDRVRRIGVLLNLSPDDPETRKRLGVFLKMLAEQGWSEARNLKIEYRWGMADPDRHRANAAEIVALAPDVILAHGGTILRPLLRATKTVPIVFVAVGDPVAAGFIESLARPGGSATGFATFEYGLGGKWGELLKQIAPSIRRVAILRDPEGISGTGQIGALQSVAQALGLELSPISVRTPAQIERALVNFARLPNGGLIVTSSGFLQIHRELIVGLAARHRLPAIYPNRIFVSAGGLASYGPEVADRYRLAAGYVDRILKGAKPAELPVQHPNKFELVLNLKTAKALGLELTLSLLTSADEVIE